MKIENIDNKVYNLLEKSLDVSSLRSKVIANNLANINTKNYKRMYVTFEDTLENAKENLCMRKTNEKHMEDEQQSGSIGLKKDETSSTRQDGNNVNLDSEVVNQSANTLMYDALTTELNNRIAMRRSVIKGGR